jgi:Zn-dependent peptidase ImmA (M78 family)
MNRVDVNPDIYRWACERARIAVPALAGRFPRLPDWEAGSAAPTLRQLEAFAAATYTPLGFFFLPQPPSEAVPIPDFRTVGSVGVTEPSANLLDTIYTCQQRQEWYRDFARTTGEDPLAFVGSVAQGADVVVTAATIRAGVGFDLDARERTPTWEDALRQFIGQVEDAGILVMVSGVVLNNTHRRLGTDEFRGFAIADPFAPVVFVNGADTKSGQMFTLAHELVHIWAGQSALSNAQPRELRAGATEQWCNAVAAEMLVPIAMMRQAFNRDAELGPEMQRLARRFKVSTLVILRRIHDIGALPRDAFWEAYDAELDRLRELGSRGGGGGNFHFTEAARVSGRFARAIVASTLAGQTLYRDAFRMLGFSKMQTFRDFGRSLGVSL